MERKLTEDGMEMTWAVNHLAPFLLTTLLIDRLKQSGGRIITTASYGHKMAKEGIRFDDLTAERCYSLPHRLLLGASVRYAETKLANILFTSELAKRLQGTGATAHCFNPGLVSTNFNQGNGWAAQLTMAIMKLYSRPPEKGAETLVWLADSDEISGQSGHYYTDKQIDAPTPHAQDSETAKRLWEVSLEQIQS
ncbi:oxidoreductase [Paenibacillus konkukensis]|uniref:Oxidoreductase n=1 Tax=Paenibacillus konkukensis TaxID=2020716 RepID=A0ABY4RYM0_9BACL|nr:oxidoreductase [Paenibacillus konkukensis]